MNKKTTYYKVSMIGCKPSIYKLINNNWYWWNNYVKCWRWEFSPKREGFTLEEISEEQVFLELL